MGRTKSESVLLTDLGNRILERLLLHKEGINGYQISKETYRSGETHSPTKIYSVLSRFENEKLTTIEDKPIKNKKRTYHKLNFKTFAEKFNYFFIKDEFKLNEEETLALSNFFEKIDYSSWINDDAIPNNDNSKRGFDLSALTRAASPTVFESLGLLVYFLADMKKDRNANAKQIKKVLKKEGAEKTLGNLFHDFDSMKPPTIFEKLIHVEPNPTLRGIFGLIQNGIILGAGIRRDFS